MVDVANVMGARADGWWRDRAGAALRLCREVDALARRGDERDVRGGPSGSSSLRGRRARRCALLLADEGEPPLVRLVSAPGSGDDAIVGVVAEVVARAETCLVVTADRELRRRCEELTAAAVGPGWLLRLL